MSVQAIVLAGSRSREPLRRLSESRSKAAVRLFGRPMIEYVLDALLTARRVESVVVVGAPDLVTVRGEIRHAVRWIPSGTSIAQSLRLGLQAHSSDRPILVAACDIPLITRDAVDHFVKMGVAKLYEGAEMVYPLVPRTVMKTVMPRARKTCLRLVEGAFSGGNMALIKGGLNHDSYHLLERADRWRKHPVVLGSMLGWTRGARLFLGRISIPQIEEEVFRASKTRVRAAITPYASIGFDIDRPQDYFAALACMAESAGQSLSVAHSPLLHPQS